MIPAAVINGDERHTSFHKSPREQASLTKTIAAIALAQFVVLTVNVERLLRLAGADQAIALLIEPIDIAHRIGRGFFIDSHHPIDQLSQILAALESTFG